MQSLKLHDISDRELLHIIFDERDNDGWTSSYEIADRLGLKHDSPAQCVGARLSWLASEPYLGTPIVERHESKPLWRVTQHGRQLMNDDLTAAQEHMLSDMDSARTLALLDGVTRRYRRSGMGTARLYDRQWRYGTGR